MKTTAGTSLDAHGRRQRKEPRLQKYDYASPGVYFVTICTLHREMLFGRVVNRQMALNEFGEIVSDAIVHLTEHYDTVQVECSVVMPNHIHMIIWIQESNDEMYTLGNIVRGFKSEAARKCGRKIWQRGYHEHIVRNEQDLLEIRAYIESNPIKWEVDRHNPDNEKYAMWQEPM